MDWVGLGVGMGRFYWLGGFSHLVHGRFGVGFGSGWETRFFYFFFLHSRLVMGYSVDRSGGKVEGEGGCV